jgi:hypothetical protein
MQIDKKRLRSPTYYMRSSTKMRWITVDTLRVGDAIVPTEGPPIIILGIEKIPYHLRFRIIQDGTVYTEDLLPTCSTWGCLLRGPGWVARRGGNVTGGGDPQDLGAEQESSGEDHDPAGGLGEGLDGKGD